MRSKLTLILLGVSLAAFALGMAHLFKLRFETGDVYPAYSSLRTDPLGTQAFYESLELMPGISARRDMTTANRLPDGKDTTYLHLAGRVDDWETLPEDLLREIDAFLARGGRLVIAFFPEIRNASQSVLGEIQKAEKVKERPVKSGKPQKQPEDQLDRVFRFTPTKKRWGVEFMFVGLEQNDHAPYKSVSALRKASLPLPDSLSWHSGTVFTNLNAAWNIIYTRDKHPVVVERKFGPGSVVLASDSYFLSNQAMREERHADLLAWLVGSNQRVVFDEAHLGVTEEPGIATLIRKYRLHGLVVSFLVLAGLFVWKNSMSFLSPYEEELSETHVAGKESAAGFVNLLRRNLPSRDLLNVCLAEWKKSAGADAKVSPAKQQRIEAVIEAENALPRKQRDPINTYQTICAILKERSEFRVPNSQPQADIQQRKAYG